MPWQPPTEYATRPVAILGAGVLGRRIACTWASAGYNIHVRDPSAEQRSQCRQYVKENMTSYNSMTSSSTVGKIETFEELELALVNAWLVIEAIPEKLELKISTFASLEKMVPRDCILATNSSSYKSSEMLSKVSEHTKRRMLNTHYYMPPENMVVELMTDGFTEEGIFPFLAERLRETGALPYIARKESTGFIINRLWAAVKRETLMILSEGVSDAEEIDGLWTECFIKAKMLPCRTMDKVGLDTVAMIESHYIAERGLPSEHTTDYLKKNYLDHGKLGIKCEAGGLYPPENITDPAKEVSTCKSSSSDPTIIVLDIGLSSTDSTSDAGEILQLTADGKLCKTLVSKLSLPDGIAIDDTMDRMFWTCMGKPGKPDGTVMSAKTDGTDMRTLVSPGTINTPKQLSLDTKAQKLYFCDREGCAVYRCDYDGSQLEILVKNSGNASEKADVLDWCVGITISHRHGKFYWTQKGPSKGEKGRIFCANIATPQGRTAESREDVECIIYGLFEPIDLELDEASNRLYWTDRGEIPWGNSLNRVDLNDRGLPNVDVAATPAKAYVIARRFDETIGLKLDVANERIYVTDLGGSIYCCDLDGQNKKRIYSDEMRAFSGIAIR